MDKQQFATLAIAIKAAYPASKVLEDNASMDFWYMMLNDIDYQVAENAVSEHICTNVFPPNIAEIRRLCMERCKRPVLSFDEAWGTVQRAISAYGWDNPEKAYETMDELTVSVVRNLGWSRICRSENPEADRANFREAYKAKAEAFQNQSQLPEFVAKEKVLLQERYIPVIEHRENPEIESKDPVSDVRENLTEEQIEARARMVAEAKRRILSGKTE